MNKKQKAVLFVYFLWSMFIIVMFFISRMASTESVNRRDEMLSVLFVILLPSLPTFLLYKIFGEQKK